MPEIDDCLFLFSLANIYMSVFLRSTTTLSINMLQKVVDLLLMRIFELEIFEIHHLLNQTQGDGIYNHNKKYKC